MADTSNSLAERTRLLWRAEGTSALVRKGADVALRTVLTYAALSTYYPRVGYEILRWKLRRAPTVIATSDGECSFPGGRFAVFLIHQPNDISWYVRNALGALRSARTNVVLVVNHALKPQQEAELRRLCHKIIIRDNTGLDFGGYRDGYFAVVDNENVERLLFLNDSVYFFEEGLEDFFERMISSSSEVSAPFENRQFHYHIQSFCVAVSGRMMRHAAVRHFFDAYMPVNSRRWAIHKGEFELSRALTANAETIDIMYSLDNLVSHDNDLRDDVRGNLAAFLPIAQRRQYRQSKPDGRADNGMTLQEFASIASRYSQVHAAGFLFRAMLRSPLLKRDLIYREQFERDDLEWLLRTTGDEGHGDEILIDLDRKGSGSKYRGLDRGRYSAGMI